MDALENIVQKRVWNHRLNVQIDYNILYSKFKEREEKKEAQEKWQWWITLVMFVLPVLPLCFYVFEWYPLQTSVIALIVELILSGSLLMLSYQVKILNADIEKIETGSDEIAKILDDYHDLYHEFETREIDDVVEIDKDLYEKYELITQISMKGVTVEDCENDRASDDANMQIDNYDGKAVANG
ncbi:MAG: hypothetical protein F4X51_00290 [Gemmatimonadetes bacterium]|nr:hypothetical protein [Gemmatimonadota bacterium]